MNKKLLLKYLLLALPFLIGSILYSLGIYNILSSILFFCGGYIFIKNISDYRKIQKNKNNLNIINKIDNDIKKEYRSYDSIIGLKRTRRYSRVRKRIKY